MDMIIGAYTPIRFKEVIPGSGRAYVQAQLFFAGVVVRSFDWYWKPAMILADNYKYKAVIRTPA